MEMTREMLEQAREMRDEISNETCELTEDEQRELIGIHVNALVDHAVRQITAGLPINLVLETVNDRINHAIDSPIYDTFLDLVARATQKAASAYTNRGFTQEQAVQLIVAGAGMTRAGKR